MPPEDEVFLVEEQPLPAAISPTADSPGYVPESDSEEDLEEDPADYLADGGDDGDDEDELIDDDEDDDVDIEEMRRRRSTQLLPTLQLLLYQLMSIRAETPISLPFREEVERLIALPLPPPSPFSPWSSPLLQIPSPPLLVLLPIPVSPLPLPASPTYPLGYRAVMIRLRAEAPSTSHILPLPSPIEPPSGTPPLLPIPLPTPSPPLLLPSTDRRADRDVGYGITDTWDEMLVGMPGEPVTDEIELGQWVTDLVTTIRQDTDKIYGRLDDAQTERQMVTSRVNMLFRDRRAYTRTARLMEIEARMSREAWGWSIDASDLVCIEVMALRTQVVA
ncbi:hypothetical protein Tco_1357365 [Tanacetum coccineum]